MTTLYRVRSEWTGFVGAPGVTTMYALDISTFLDDLATLWTAVAAYLPTDVTITVPRTGDRITDTDGSLVGSWTDTGTLFTVNGAASGGYAAPVGCCINWGTDTVSDGRRLRARTFVVPLQGNRFDPDGTLHDEDRTNMVNDAVAFYEAQSSTFVAYRRERMAKAADGSRKAVTHRDGSHALITSASIPDKAVVLRSRRD